MTLRPRHDSREPTPRERSCARGGPAEARPYGSKVLINACKPHRYMKQFPLSTLLRREVYERVAARWSELGFSEPAPKLNVFHKD